MPESSPLRRVLIANRGEIAVRIARTCRVMRLELVGVHSPHDAHAPHVAACGRSIGVPGYLDAEAVVAAARTAGCDAVHPGYGFLSENADFARAVERARLTWVGPPPAAMDVMGSKTSARAAMEKAGVPVVPGTAPGAPERLVGPAAELGYPVLVKAAAGGGGKGMAVVERPADLVRAARACSEMATEAFGDDAVYLERLLVRPRHVEVQVIGDASGRVVALGERECSIQRRHQKVIEETPSLAVDPDLRARLLQAAVAAAEAVSYRSAGTVEFFLEPDGRFWFLEMNTRLQVEHPVTEWVTGLDLVRLQLEIAAGRELPAAAREPSPRGHAMECRVVAEDPAAGHVPQAGPLLVVREPSGPGVRVDSALAEGGEVGIHYDPLLAKVSTFGATREEARARMLDALARFVVLGVRTNLDFLQDVLEHPEFIAGDVSTSWLEERFATWQGAPPAVVALAGLGLAAAHAPGGAPGAPAGGQGPVVGAHGLRGGVFAERAVTTQRLRVGPHELELAVTLAGGTVRVEQPDGKSWELPAAAAGSGSWLVEDREGRSHVLHAARHRGVGRVHVQGRTHVFEPVPTGARPAAGSATDGRVLAPMTATVVERSVEPGARVEAGTVLVVLSAMKMRLEVKSPVAGVVRSVAESGRQVEGGEEIAVVEPAAP